VVCTALATTTVQVRAYLRHRAGLPPVTTGSGALNAGHVSLFERELLFIHDVLPKDADVHDGLQLLDGGDPNRHYIPSVATSVAPAAPALPPAPASAPVPAHAAPAPVVVGGAPPGVMLPVPPQPMRLEALPVGVVGRGTVPAPNDNASSVGRHGEHEHADVGDEEEDDEIRPVRDNRASQWRAYHATGF